ncbi:MAG TPA: right-handed parallel beta-helix repeat-containing protein, partial [Herpetosiphonaceae bacterium]|nr:right-handed parallel beta-helix repeat-containing protein [Herpetosiphonaceae bacterium]
LVIEGWNTTEKPAFYEFYIGAINFVYCDRATISNVIVRYWHSDGISLQTCNNSTITDTASNQNRGHGFHPGTGSNYLEFVRITAIGNLGFTGRGTAGDGLYYCWGNQFVNIRQSTFNDNAGAGVGDVGGGDTNNTFFDYNNVIEDSVMERNGKAGIDITGGSAAANTIIQRNIVRDNNKLKTGQAGIMISAKKGHAQRFTVSANTVESTASTPTQLVGIQEINPNGTYATDYNIIRDNVVRNHSQANIVSVGPNTTLSNNTNGAAVTSFVLYNADTDQPIAGFNPMPASSTLNFATLGTRNLSIRAFTNPGTVGSVRFVLDGASYRLENSAPYTIAGDATSTDYNAWTPGLGVHTLTGVAYSAYGGSGVAGPNYTITFNVIDQAPATATSQPTATATATPPPTATATSQPTATATSQPTASVPPPPTLPATAVVVAKAPQVVSLTLYNADTDQPISGFNPLPANAMLRFSSLGTRNLSVVAKTNPSTVGSTSFRLDGVLLRVENNAPFAILGDTNGTDYNAWTPSLGTHTLQVVAYSGANQTGTASPAYSLTFTVTE